MTNLTTKEIKAYEEIIKSAPRGATHYVVLQYDMIEVYWRIDDCCIYTLNEDGETWGYREGVEADGCYLIDSLEHIRTILAKQQEIERLREENDRLKSSYGDNWYDGFIAARNISRDRFSDLQGMDDSEVLGLSEDAEQIKAKGESDELFYKTP